MSEKRDESENRRKALDAAMRLYDRYESATAGPVKTPPTTDAILKEAEKFYKFLQGESSQGEKS